MKINLPLKRLQTAAIPVLILLVLSSCTKKDNGSDAYSIRFKVDDVAVEFTQQSSLVADFTQAGTQYNATFNGTLKASGKSDIEITEGNFFVWRSI